MIAVKSLLSLVLLFMHSALIRCQSGNCLEGCLYSYLPPACGNRGSILRFKLNPSTKVPSGLDMCGTDCSKNSGTKLYLIRQPSAGRQVLTIRMALNCRYALAAVSGSLRAQVITKVNNKIPTKFQFKRESDRGFLLFRSVSASRLYIALASPDKVTLVSTNRNSRNHHFLFYNSAYCSTSCSV